MAISSFLNLGTAVVSASSTAIKVSCVDEYVPPYLAGLNKDTAEMNLTQVGHKPLSNCRVEERYLECTRQASGFCAQIKKIFEKDISLFNGIQSSLSQTDLDIAKALNGGGTKQPVAQGNTK